VNSANKPSPVVGALWGNGEDHFWPEREVLARRGHVSSRVNSGLNVLAASLTGFDPLRTSRRERRREHPSLPRHTS
jgi:hypothetical protein